MCAFLKIIGARLYTNHACYNCVFLVFVMLQVKALSCTRDQRRLFSSLSFSVAGGQLLQIVGANGSGKSTLLRCLVGLYSGYEGEIDWSLEEAPLYLGHRSGVKDSLTVLENLRWLTSLRNLTLTDDEVQETLKLLRLQGYDDVVCGRLSEGQRKRVVLAQFLLCPNRCWVMDEPLSAIDDRGLELLTDRMGDHLEGGGAIILSSHQPVPIDRPVSSVTLG